MQIQQISDTDELDADFEREFGVKQSHQVRLLSGFKKSTPWTQDEFGNLCRLHGDL
jgi:hypothetical protein